MLSWTRVDAIGESHQNLRQSSALRTSAAKFSHQKR